MKAITGAKALNKRDVRMDSRTRIIERIRKAIGSQNTGDDIEAEFNALCQAQADTPAQPSLSHVETVSRFMSEAQRNGAVVTEVDDMDQVYAWLENEAQTSEIPPTVTLSPWAAEVRQDWGTLNVATGAPQPIQSWGLVRAHSGIAETGTIMSLSRECPSSLLFLVERLVVLIDKQDIVRFQEDAWDRLLDGQALPRTVNLITGPSRTADIEQQIQIGAHGPRRADYLIVESLPR